MYILEIQHLNKSYGNTKALNEIDLHIPSGMIFGILGPNGAGKTTLIRIINQIIDKDSGNILFKGQPLQRKHIGHIGYLPEERGLYKKMKVWDQLVYFARLKGLSASDANKKVNQWLDKMEITHWKQKRIDDLSKGMAQKVQFISAVIHEPELIILDEPFSGFDPVNAEVIKNEILALKERGATLLLSTHRMESVEQLCDEIAMFNKSEKILSGRLSDIKNQFRNNEFEISIQAQYEKEIPHTWKLIAGGPEKTFLVSLENQTTNELLEAAMQLGQIKGFKEILPSMEQIFIQQVKTHSNG
ncbi:ABC transporter ATP-binding protein [Cecembia rubra]|uniref:ABC-2 type transport system ATP-binding protein n=1 Tax=Cecembia rubra TaxID=1485585 RepID=A0A2P8E8B3_9BACT|nr:ATP-binding cassette domain-containing protein [Cecembia rubra]PSL05720.1 ABC-2 type transport system ATP-binding protein [Cecembia rubra]